MVSVTLNVVHEAGLFQGRLGFQKAIILLEEGCEDFSNIDGLGRIGFPKGTISAKFEEIRAVLRPKRDVLRKRQEDRTLRLLMSRFHPKPGSKFGLSPQMLRRIAKCLSRMCGRIRI